MRKFDSKKILAGSEMLLIASPLVGTQGAVNSGAVFNISEWWIYVAIMRFIFGEEWSKQKFKDKLIDEFKRKNSEKFEGVKFECSFDDQRNTCKVDFDFDGNIKLPLELEFSIEENFGNSNEDKKVNPVKVKCENLDYKYKESTFYDLHNDEDLEKMYKKVNKWHDGVEQDLKLLNQLDANCGFERSEKLLSDGIIEFLVSGFKYKVERNKQERWIKKINYDSYSRMVYVYGEDNRSLCWFFLDVENSDRELGYKDFENFISKLKEFNVIKVNRGKLEFAKKELMPLENANMSVFS